MVEVDFATAGRMGRTRDGSESKAAKGEGAGEEGKDGLRTYRSFETMLPTPEEYYHTK